MDSADLSIDSLSFSLTSMDMSSLNMSHGSLENVTSNEAAQCKGNLRDNGNNIIDQIISHFLRHNYSLVCLEGFMELLNINREMCDKLPEKKKQILKMFSEHRDSIEMFFYIKCDVCQKTVCIKSDSSEQLKCCAKILKKSETNFFVYLPIKKQITQSIQNNWEYIKKFDTKSKIGCYSDVHDGEILKNIYKQYEKEIFNILSLCLNTDGANVFNSNKSSLWPIQFTQNFLPPDIRFQSQNIIVAGLFYTDSGTKLNFRDYLLPLVYELNHLKEDLITVTIEETDYMFKPIITHCCVDLPAKSKIQETKQFGGYNACTFCKNPGEQVIIQRSKKGKGKKQPGNQQKPLESIRYVEGDIVHQLRDETETLEKMLSASSANDAVDGIKDVSCLVAFDHFNIVASFSVEYMHCVLLGVQKRILKLLLDSTNKSHRYYMPPKKKKLLSDRIVAIKPNADVVRKPRSLEQMADFKASEYRFLLLYYLPVCLEGCVPKEYVQHIRLLSGAVYMLLQTTIAYEEVDEAEIMLRKFVKQHQDLFGKENMVMNIHLLIHLANSVRKLGPLWCHSAFPFERNNGVLVRMVSGTTDVLLQISSKYCLKKSLVKKCKKSDEESSADEKILLGKGEIILEKSLRAVNTDTLKEVDLSSKDLCVYKRIKLGTTVYTSLLYTRPKKSIDYFIGLKNDIIGMAKFYTEINSKIYVVIDEYETVEFINHISKIQRTNRNILAPIDDIQMKYIYIKVGLHQYITSSPNPYEKE